MCEYTVYVYINFLRRLHFIHCTFNTIEYIRRCHQNKQQLVLLHDPFNYLCIRALESSIQLYYITWLIHSQHNTVALYRWHILLTELSRFPLLKKVVYGCGCTRVCSQGRQSGVGDGRHVPHFLKGLEHTFRCPFRFSVWLVLALGLSGSQWVQTFC